jgi:hypothetical protein
MGMTSASTPPAAALVADAIARIEERRDVLDRLARKGMEMVERLAAGEDVEIAGRKPFADPARAFAVISRAVRLCLALGCRLDQEIIALLRGGPIPTLAILAPEAPAALKTSAAEPETPVPASGPRERIARAIDAVIEAETADREAAERQRAYVEEHLIEGEDYDAFLHQPWRVVVQIVCADLGLHPDWSAWDNTEAFRVGRMQEKADPSPLAGEDLPRAVGSDEGSCPTFNDRSRRDNTS